MATLDQEIKTYNDRLPTLLTHAGKHVLIKGNDIAGTFDSYEDALKFGYGKFGLEPFLIKKIAPAEQVSYFTRSFVGACPA